MIELSSPESESELLILRSILDDAGIPHFVHNDTFGSMVAGPRIALYNGKRILVHETDYREARAVVGEFLAGTPATAAANSRAYSLTEKLRMIAELLIFGWFLPGSRFRTRPRLRLIKGFRPDPE